MFRNALYAAAAAGLAWNLIDWIRRHDRYAVLQSDGAPLLLDARMLLWLGAVAVLAVIVWRRRPAVPTWAQARALLYCPAIALLASTVAHPIMDLDPPRWTSRLVFFTALALVQCVWGLAIAMARTEAPRRRLHRTLDVALLNTVLAILVLEGIASAWATWKPSPLLAGPSVEDRLAARRRPPGEPYFDRHLNSGGFADGEFFRAGPDDLVVAVIGDSFGFGTVPISRNFITVAERILDEELGEDTDRIGLHNFGVPGIGPSEYALVLMEHALATNPRVVVLCLFVGNDITGGSLFADRSTERYRLQDWYVYLVSTRIVKLMRTDASTLRGLEEMGADSTARRGIDDAEEESAEEPTFSLEDFLEIERQRFGILDITSSPLEQRFESLRADLSWFHDQLGERLQLVIIPDEFQVDDALFELLLAELPDRSTHVRDLPQRRIRSFCEAQSVPCLDLLPALRKAERDGRTYQLRDTHWNLRGNRVAGAALARSLLAHPLVSERRH